MRLNRGVCVTGRAMVRYMGSSAKGEEERGARGRGLGGCTGPPLLGCTGPPLARLVQIK